MRQFPENPHFQELADEHRHWLQAFDPQYLANWEKLLAGDHEAGLYEAAVRRNLQSQGVTVEPNESLTGDNRCPDFRCTLREYRFCVEVSCIPISKAEEKTGVPSRKPGFYPCSPFRLIESVLSKSRNKYEQFRGLDAPALLAVGTFEGYAAMSLRDKWVVASVLTGKTKIGWGINIQSGETSDAYQFTDFEDSSFLNHDAATGDVGNKNSPISGILLGGIGCPFLGVLNPAPTRQFDPAVLPGVAFGEVIVDRGNGELRVRWSDGTPGSGQ